MHMYRHFVDIIYQNNAYLASTVLVDGLALLAWNTGMILGWRPASESGRYFVTTSLIGWVEA